MKRVAIGHLPIPIALVQIMRASKFITPLPPRFAKFIRVDLTFGD
jgi:hypothetical protein